MSLYLFTLAFRELILKAKGEELKCIWNFLKRRCQNVLFPLLTPMGYHHLRIIKRFIAKSTCEFRMIKKGLEVSPGLPTEMAGFLKRSCPPQINIFISKHKSALFYINNSFLYFSFFIIMKQLSFRALLSILNGCILVQMKCK